MHITKRTIQNYALGMIKSLALMFLGLWATPKIIHYLGETDFGTFKVIQEIQSHLGLLEKGIYSALMMLFIKNHHDKNHREDVVFQIGRNKYLFLTLFYFICGALLFIPTIKILHLNFNWEVLQTARFYCYAILIFSGIFFPMQVFRAYLEAHMREDLLHILAFFQTVFLTLVSLYFAYLGYGLLAQSTAAFLSNAIPSVFFLVYFFIYHKHNFSSFFKKSNNNNNEMINKELNQGQKSNLINEFAGKLSHMTDNILVSLFLGPAQVTAFFISQRLPQLFQLFSLGIGNSTWAALGHTYHKKEYDVFRDRVYQLTKIISVISLCGFTVIAAYHDDFVNLWTGTKFYLGQNFTIVVCLGLFIQSILSFWGWLFIATGKPEAMTNIVVPQAIANFILSLLFIKYLGVIGPVLGTLCSYVLIGILFFSYRLKTLFHFSFWRLNFIWLKALTIGVGYYQILIFFLKLQLGEVQHWSGLIWQMPVSSIPLFIISLFFLCNAQDRNYFFEILLNRFKK